ncbi:MAG: hypothetical protein AYK22_05905 [Thermoplasmatales archaeon SG8-52-3]|nr:MAG: hypothetical protein AYK22_05905 [Thermoplasmatales archaeon SG8-52-3]
MKNKIIGILICTLLIATSTVITVKSIETQNITNYEKIDINNEESKEETIEIDNISILNSGFEQCIAACMGIPLAGNCLYFIIGCALSPGPHNFCCWAVPIFCGVDIGLLFSCITNCIDQFGDLYDETPCFPKNIIRMIKLIQNNNSSGPALIIGLMCLFQRLQKVLEWLKEQGYTNIEIPETKDCGCNNEP